MKFLLTILLLVAGPVSAMPSSNAYDEDIQRAARLYLPIWEWHWLKAQLYTESRLNPDAVSPVGAQGIAQFMPGTWSDVSKAMKFGLASPRVAAQAIQAAAFYDAQLRSKWKAEREEIDRIRLTMASYNAGIGNILKAQRKCLGGNKWREIAPCLVQVTGKKNSKETLDYVRLIEERQAAMLAARL